MQTKMSLKLAGALLSLLTFAGAAYAAPGADGPTASQYPVMDVTRVNSFIAQPPRPGQNRQRGHGPREPGGLPPRFAIPERVSLDTANQRHLGEPSGTA